ncbi:MAG: CpsB/CapC family capsule biosynthesis tyrosine phosphatase [Desulfobacterales bacterium]
MIDLHSHILPGIDDGPQTLEESIDMAKAFSANGYTVAAATPHMIPGTTWMPSADRIKQKTRELNLAIAQEKLALRVVSGMEVALDPQIPDLLDQGHLLGLGDTAWLLIEPPFLHLPRGWEHIIFSVLSRGFSVLLAHPERCKHLTDEPQAIERLMASGVHLQANWGSFIGQYGRIAARTAHFMAENGWIHCLATDSHRAAGLDPVAMKMARDRIMGLIGEDNLALIGSDNPGRVLCGGKVAAMTVKGPMAGAKKARGWRFWKNN